MDPVPVQLADALPVHIRSAAEKVEELRRLQQLKAMLAAYELDLVAGLAGDRPDTFDREPGRPGAAASDGVPGPGAPAGVSEFFADELALVLATSRAAATTLIDQATTLTERLPATRAALAEGRLDWPRARAIAGELGWKARATDPRVVAAVEAAVLPRAGELSIRRLQALVQTELTARDSAAAGRRRDDALRGANVVVRPIGDGISELAARMPHEFSTACRQVLDGLARAAAKEEGEQRPLGMLRVGALAGLVLRPWDADREPVTAQLTVTAPLDALAPARFLATGGAVPAVFARPEPTGEVDGQPITAAHLRELLTQLDAVCPGGLQAPTGGSMTIAITDDCGALLATTTRRDVERIARRGCSTHGPDTACGCPLLHRPAPTDAYRPTAAQRRWVATRDRTCRHPGCRNQAGWADLDHVLPHARGGRRRARTSLVPNAPSGPRRAGVRGRAARRLATVASPVRHGYAAETSASGTLCRQREGQPLTHGRVSLRRLACARGGHLRYEPNPKHKEPWQRGASGSMCPTHADGPTLLAESVQHPTKPGKRYATDGEHAYCGHQHAPDVWHGFPVLWREVPESVRRQWLAERKITRRALRSNF
ncbi:DUF222 domain-containing protein [Geodermatophilus sp. CPCC 206100]|uniref:DUF222 domain-containing protein n=1 Tax=Geodermatophilus sp. CPCC 206100 TaxID=3020054 RepID=UPI003AFFB1B8